MVIKIYLIAPKALIDALNSRGHSVSNVCIKSLTTDISNSIISQWNDLGLVIPSQSAYDVFKTVGFDNVDWNAKSTVAKPMSTLHGTIVVLHQHFNETDITETSRIIVLNPE